MSDLTQKGFAINLDFKTSEQGIFEGYGAVFNNVDSGQDMIMPGAFAKTLKNRDAKAVKMLWMHDSEDPIGFWTSIEEDKKGLKLTGQLLLSLKKAKEVYEMMQAGIIDSLSVGYRTVKSMYDEATSVRKLLELELWEVSAVTFPMNDKAKIQTVKSGLEIPTRKQIETALRNEGAFSNADARKAAAIVKKILRNGEDEPATTLRHEEVHAFKGALDNLMSAIRS